jgi:predicted DNA-binding transcriptional regulator AlpA
MEVVEANVQGANSQQHVVEPRGLSRAEAAFYIGVSPSLFDALVRDGRMPQPKRINTRTVWDRRQIDEFFAALPGGSVDELNVEWQVAV